MLPIRLPRAAASRYVGCFGFSRLWHLTLFLSRSPTATASAPKSWPRRFVSWRGRARAFSLKPSRSAKRSISQHPFALFICVRHGNTARRFDERQCPVAVNANADKGARRNKRRATYAGPTVNRHRATHRDGVGDPFAELGSAAQRLGQAAIGNREG